MKRAGTIKVEARGPDGPIEALLLPPGTGRVRVEIRGGGFMREALLKARAQMERDLAKALKDAARRSAQEARRR